MNELPATPRAPVTGFRYYDFLLGGMVAVLLCANLIGPAKVGVITLPLLGALSFGAGNVFFPISYICDDLITEVYGYARARRVAWTGLGALAFATVMSQFIVHVPAAPSEPFNATLQPALETVFGSTWRIATASMFAYICGDFVNSFVLAKMKVMTNGRWLWTRTVGSTMAGQAVDSLLFYPLAFYDSGLIANDMLPKVMLAQFVTKVAVEVVFTPVTYRIVGFLKRAEHEDYYDRRTNFNPFKLGA